MNQFWEMKGIKREFSVARTPQQNGVDGRKNRTLIEAARTMLLDSKPPLIDFMKPFGCPVTILNTRDHQGKFDEKADEGYFIGYSVISKAIRVFNKRTRIVEETLNIRFLENAPNVKGTKDNIVAGPKDSEDDAGMKPTEEDEIGALDNGGKDAQDTRSESERIVQMERQTEHTNSINSLNTV
ncbi:ribonuclease H-like domain-containing protein, partial [Tanacetum coccineum]